MAAPNLWELFRWDRPLKWTGSERYKDFISIMQISDKVLALGVLRAAALSSLSLFPPPWSAGTLRALKCSYILPAAFYSTPVLWIAPPAHFPEGPKTFRHPRSLGASCTGPGLLAAWKSLSLRKS